MKAPEVLVGLGLIGMVLFWVVAMLCSLALPILLALYLLGHI